jgi:hypothetical protein
MCIAMCIAAPSYDSRVDLYRPPATELHERWLADAPKVREPFA